MSEKKLILGLDVSTKTTGIVLMLVEGDEKKIILVTHCAPKISAKIKGMESLFLKKNIFEDEFLKKYLDIGITHVIIEEPLIYGPNAKAVAPLLRFNALISDSIYRLLGIVPDYISSYDARSNAFPELMAKRKFNKKGEKISESQLKKSEPVLFGDFGDIDKKQVILDKVSDVFPDIEWLLDKNNEKVKESYDSSDAICCVLGWLNKNK